MPAIYDCPSILTLEKWVGMDPDEREAAWKVARRELEPRLKQMFERQGRRVYLLIGCSPVGFEVVREACWPVDLPSAEEVATRTIREARVLLEFMYPELAEQEVPRFRDVNQRVRAALLFLGVDFR